MRLKLRLTLVFGALGFVSLASASALAYFVTAEEVRQSIDNELLQRLGPFTGAEDGAFPGGTIPTADGAEIDVDQLIEDGFPFRDPEELNVPGDITLFQLVDDDLTVRGEPGVSPSDAAIASFDVEGAFLESATVGGTEYRILTLPVSGALARLPTSADGSVRGIQLYRDVSNENAALSNLLFRLTGLTAIGVAAVVAVSWLVGRWLSRPIVQLTETAEHLAELDDVPGRVEIHRSDEIGRLADSYNRLMSALEVGREQQRRLVADASHELRTPLTSLRMRVEYLAQNDPPAQRRQEMLEAAVVDATHLSILVSDLVDLAVDVRSADESPEPCRVDELVDEVVEHTRLSTGREIEVESDATVATVRPTMVRRALHNLIDNAAKYSPEGSPISVCASSGSIEVHDAGPGIAAEDAAHVFDRFFRSPKARSRPGNGIGLAIVQQVADAHGGRTFVGRSPLGGAVVGFTVTP